MSGALPVVGDGCTAYYYSDRRAYTVVEIVDSKTVVVQRDSVHRIDKNGYGGEQIWECIPNPDGEKITVTLRKNGAWVRRKQPTRGAVNYVFGYKREYEDPHY